MGRILTCWNWRLEKIKKEKLEKVDWLSKFFVARFGISVFLGKETIIDHSSAEKIEFKFYLFQCQECGRLQVDFPRGYDGYLDCGFGCSYSL